MMTPLSRKAQAMTMPDTRLPMNLAVVTTIVLAIVGLLSTTLYV